MVIVIYDKYLYIILIFIFIKVNLKKIIRRRCLNFKIFQWSSNILKSISHLSYKKKGFVQIFRNLKLSTKKKETSIRAVHDKLHKLSRDNNSLFMPKFFPKISTINKYPRRWKSVKTNEFRDKKNFSQIFSREKKNWLIYYSMIDYIKLINIF